MWAMGKLNGWEIQKEVYTFSSMAIIKIISRQPSVVHIKIVEWSITIYSVMAINISSCVMSCEEFLMILNNYLF